jgi:hypothetical protein
MRFPRRAAAPLPQPFTFECSCGNTQHSLDRSIPVGWSILRTVILCPDCTTSAVKRAGRRVSPRNRIGGVPKGARA